VFFAEIERKHLGFMVNKNLFQKVMTTPWDCKIFTNFVLKETTGTLWAAQVVCLSILSGNCLKPQDSIDKG
jgi:hypothetical protein